MTVQMIAAKRFRMSQDNGFCWLNAGEPYEVPSEKSAEFHETSGRGKRAETKPAKSGKGE